MHWRKALDNAAGILILLLGIVWGMISLRKALPAFFTLGETRLLGDLTALIFGFFVVLPTAIMAFWRPTISAVLLATGFSLAEIAVLVDYGLRDTWILGEQMSPNLLLALGYGYLAFSRSR
jgi:hypothetical protein